MRDPASPLHNNYNEILSVEVTWSLCEALTKLRADISNDRYYLPPPWCRVLLEKLTGLQLVKKFPEFHGTRRFITEPTSVRYPSLSWASSVQSIYPHPTSWRSILILSTHLRLSLPSDLFPSGFPTKTLYNPSPHPYAPQAHLILLHVDFINDQCYRGLICMELHFHSAICRQGLLFNPFSTEVKDEYSHSSIACTVTSASYWCFCSLQTQRRGQFCLSVDECAVGWSIHAGQGDWRHGYVGKPSIWPLQIVALHQKVRKFQNSFIRIVW